QDPGEDLRGRLGGIECEAVRGGQAQYQREQRRPAAQDDGVLEVVEVVGAEHRVVVGERGVEEEDRRGGCGIRLPLEPGQDGPEDREEDEQRDRVGEHVEPERAGLDADAARQGEASPHRDGGHEVSPRLNVRVSNRSRSAATIELKMIASTPCADDEPTSLACEIVWYT